ncbi:hypothetical protein [Streptomyces scopuliridis]|uniref:hypothetical protein n=1 Tax=Streptomyces scopuliridis TaxID=452529 RepID=UPI0036A02323
MLPSYVERRHDQELRACLDKTASGQDATFIMVRGESCTGKSRTAYEAVRACLSDWKLVFPKDSESLLAILAADALSAQTIVWLNEAQEFLSGPLGESAAVALRRRLEQDGPVVIIATLWPAYYRTLTDRPESSGNDSGHAGNLGKLASILEKEDRRDLGEYLFMYGLDLDGSIAVKWQPRSVEPGWGK